MCENYYICTCVYVKMYSIYVYVNIYIYVWKKLISILIIITSILQLSLIKRKIIQNINKYCLSFMFQNCTSFWGCHGPRGLYFFSDSGHTHTHSHIIKVKKNMCKHLLFQLVLFFVFKFSLELVFSISRCCH